MPHVFMRAYGRLNDFLPPRRRYRPFVYESGGHQSVKDLIESTGIPHPEIGLILVDGRPVGLSYVIETANRISIFPPFRSIDLGDLATVRPPKPEATCFVLDTHLGRLARYLRMLGIDTLYRNDMADAELEQVSATEDRILLTQDVGLLKRSSIERGYYVRASYPRRQLVEVAAEFDLLSRATPFQRCLRCNGMLVPVAKSDIEDRLLPRTRSSFAEFYRCGECGAIYWKGSHYDRMKRIIAELERDLAGHDVDRSNR